MDAINLTGLSRVLGIGEEILEGWVREFHAFIPQTSFNRMTYFRVEAIEVLIMIKECKQKKWETFQIRKKLASQVYLTAF